MRPVAWLTRQPHFMQLHPLRCFHFLLRRSAVLFPAPASHRPVHRPTLPRRRVVVGHKPSGDSPAVLSGAYTGVEIISADTSYADAKAADGRGVAVAGVLLRGPSLHQVSRPTAWGGRGNRLGMALVWGLCLRRGAQGWE